MTWSRHLTTAAVVLLAAGCSSSGGINIDTDASPSANFSEYKTFAFGRAPASARASDQLDDINRERAETALHGALAAKGIQRVMDPSQADLIVYTFGATSQRQELTTYGSGVTYAGPRWGGMYAGPTTTTVNNITEGSLVVDMVDPRRKQVVWRGVASADVTSRSGAGEKIPTAIAKMMERFPVQAPAAPPGGN